MWKNHVILAVFVGVCLFSYIAFFERESSVADLKLSGEFDMQGLVWNTTAYFYDPLIYNLTYGLFPRVNIFRHAKGAGSNYLLMKAFYSGTSEGGLRGNDNVQKMLLARTIRAAHRHGFKVFLVPFVDSHDYWVLDKWVLDEDIWTDKVLVWAEFAQQYDVELFAPGIEMNLIFPEDRVGYWFKEILPEIRKVYSGKVATAEHPYLGKWEAIETVDGFTGFDCIGVALYPWENYGGENDIKSLEEYKSHVYAKAFLASETADKYGIDCKLVAPLGMDFWQGGFPDGQARANGFSAGLDALSELGFDGVFLHMWMSEPKHKGITESVGDMLRQRWLE